MKAAWLVGNWCERSPYARVGPPDRITRLVPIMRMVALVWVVVGEVLEVMTKEVNPGWVAATGSLVR